MDKFVKENGIVSSKIFPENNIVDNFTKALVKQGLAENKDIEKSLRKLLLQRFAIKENATNVSKYIISPNPPKDEITLKQNFNALTQFISDSLRTADAPATSSSEAKRELSDIDKAKLKYISWLNRISLPSNVEMDDFNVDSYRLPTGVTYNTDLEVKVNSDNIINNLTRLLNNEPYPQSTFEPWQIVNMANKFLNLNGNKITLETIDSFSPDFINNAVELSTNINRIINSVPPASRRVSATHRSSTSSAPKKGVFDHVQNVIERLVPEHNIKLASLFKYIHKIDLNDSPNPTYIDYLDIWNPQHTYNAIFRMQGNPDWNLAALSKYRVIHFLHHFRVCLEILHLIHFRMADFTNDVTDENFEKMKGSIYTKLLITNKEKMMKPFDKNFPLLVYAGWDMQKVESKKFIKEIGGFQLLNLNLGTAGNQNKQDYTKYYGYIDKTFANFDMKEDRIDTLLEVLCLVFSVNYKLYKHGHLVKDGDQYHLTKIGSSVPRLIGNLLVKPEPVKRGGVAGVDLTALAPGLRGQQMVQVASLHVPQTQPPSSTPVPRRRSDAPLSASAQNQQTSQVEHGPVPDFNSIYCYITNDDIKYLREVYEKHCILIVQTLIYFGVTSFHVPFPPSPKEIEKLLTHRGPTLG